MKIWKSVLGTIYSKTNKAEWKDGQLLRVCPILKPQTNFQSDVYA